jgi:queuine tRNA-ribosyltransferase
VSVLEILDKDPGSRGRAGVLHLAHGDVRTPAFVPLATKGTIKTLTPADVVALGYDMVLGNTFHLFVDPGHELVQHFGGLHRFMRWERPIITDSGGFQVFSMGHGTVADEVKGRAPQGAERRGRIVAIEEQGVRFRSYLDGSEQFMGPETSMAVQAALGSDIALAFDECTPFHVTREYTAKSTERTHRWLRRCLEWREANGPKGQLLYGIVQGGVHEDLRRESAQFVAASGCDGIAIGGSLGKEKAQIYEVARWAVDELDEAPPRHLLGIGDVDDLIHGVALGMDTFDCAMPTRLGRHGVAVIPDPDARWRVDLTASRWRENDDPIMEDCPCETCTGGFSRGYLRYLLRQREQTALRLVTMHNLTFVARLMERLRRAIGAGTLAAESKALLEGASPYGVVDSATRAAGLRADRGCQGPRRERE